jgi:hypothetical protein
MIWYDIISKNKWYFQCLEMAIFFLQLTRLDDEYEFAMLEFEVDVWRLVAKLDDLGPELKWFIPDEFWGLGAFQDVGPEFRPLLDDEGSAEKLKYIQINFTWQKKTRLKITSVLTRVHKAISKCTQGTRHKSC